MHFHFYFQSALTTLLLAALCVSADKKIELQDIEEDNLKNEKDTTRETEPEEYAARPTIVVTGAGTGRASDSNSLDYLKTSFLRLYETPVQLQQPRYVQQYAVTENQDRPTDADTPGGQTLLGYLSNVPMQILYIPQYYTDQTQRPTGPSGVQYVAPVTKLNMAAYRQEPAPDQQNYIEVPASYIAPSAKGYPLPQYTPQVTYVTYGPPQVTGPPTPTQVSAPVHQVATAPTGYASAPPPPQYSLPIVGYPHSVMAPVYHRHYNTNYQYDTNAIEEAAEAAVTKELTSHQKPSGSASSSGGESVRYYVRPSKGERGQPSQISELPPPSPLIYESQPSHLAGIPKVLPLYRPISKPIYSHISGNLIPGGSPYKGFSTKKRPSSLLESYVPSSVQLEYLKRGLSRDPLNTYEMLANSRYPPHRMERGFLPNQMYQTAAGGVTYGHYKRTPNIGDKIHI